MACHDQGTPALRSGRGFFCQEGTLMDLLDEFRRYAGECRKMANQARTSSDQELWQGIAVRWEEQCVELMKSETVAAHHHTSAHQHRKSPHPPWLHH